MFEAVHTENGFGMAGLRGLAALGDTGIQGRHDISPNEVIRGARVKLSATVNSNVMVTNVVLNRVAQTLTSYAYRTDSKSADYGYLEFNLTLLHDKDNTEGVQNDFENALDSAGVSWSGTSFQATYLPPDEGGGTQTGGGDTRDLNLVVAGTRVKWKGNLVLAGIGTRTLSVSDANLDLIARKLESRAYRDISRSSSYSEMTFFGTLAVNKTNIEGVRADFEAAVNEALSSYNTANVTVQVVSAGSGADGNGGDNPSGGKSFFDQLQDFFDKSFFGGAITGGVLALGVLVAVVIAKNR